LPRRDFLDSVTWAHRIARELQAGASGWIYWNLALDSVGGPYNLSPPHADPPDNRQHGVVIVDTAGGSYALTGLYYSIAHFARFVRPGAVRLDVIERRPPPSVDSVGFLAADGSFTLQLINQDRAEDTNVTVCIEHDGQIYATDVNLPRASITTAQWTQSQVERRRPGPT
jgi:O-glycosyl hydrolase